MAVPLATTGGRGRDEDAEEPAGYAQLQDHDSDGDEDPDHGTRPAEISIHGAHVLHINGMEIHVYGHIEGMEVAQNCSRNNVDNRHSDGDEENDDLDDDIEGGGEEEEGKGGNGSQKAGQDKEALRSAPLSLDQCEAIKNAMHGITLGGFRPGWADQIPEELWIATLKSTMGSKNGRSGKASQE